MTRNDAPTQAGSRGLPRLVFLDNLRYLMVLLVIVHHAVAAYAAGAAHWQVHDTPFWAADIIREVLDVFLMPVLFFIAGYLALPSLEKKGTWGFLKGKGKRLLVPWALAVFVFFPLLLYDRTEQLVRPFRAFWPWYLGSFDTQLRFTQTPLGPATQVVYWFISLLFAFFALLALGRALVRLWHKWAPVQAARAATPAERPLGALLVFGLLTSGAYLGLLLLVPDSSWFMLSALLEFQVTRLVPYAGCFALGVYAERRGWLAGGKPLGSLLPWGAASLALAVAYLVVGQPVFADTSGTAHLPVALLAAFAFIRSFLALSLLVVLVSAGVRYWNRASRLDRALSDASYDIYLTHFWFVVFAQTALFEWAAGPAVLKFVIVVALAMPLSFAFSRWVVGRHGRAVAVVLAALLVFCLAVRP